MKVLLLCLVSTLVSGAPFKDFDLLPLASESFPAIRVPQISGLYETPLQNFQTKLDDPVIENKPQLQITTDPFVRNIPEGLEQIDLRNSPSQDSEVRTQEIVPLPQEKEVSKTLTIETKDTKPIVQVPADLEVEDNSLIRTVEPSELYEETPQKFQPVRNNPLSSTVEEKYQKPIVQKPIDLLDEDNTLVRTVEPSGLSKEPVKKFQPVANNPVPSTFEEIYQNPIVQQSIDLKVEENTLSRAAGPSGIYEEPIQEFQPVANNPVPAIPSGLYDTPSLALEVDLRNAGNQQDGLTPQNSDDSFLLKDFEDIAQGLDQVLSEPRVPAVPSDLYEVPSGSNQDPSFLAPIEPDLDIEQQQIIEFRQQPTTASPVSTTMMMMGMPYDFGYNVDYDDPTRDASESETSFTHKQSSDGKVTRGEYSVLLPDGRTQVVKFYDDGNGFNAEVTYI